MMLRAGLWVFAGKAGHQVVNLVLVVVLARLLTPEAFGVVAATQVILTLSQVVVRFGIGAALVQTDALTRRLERTAQTLMLGVALLISAGILALSGPLSRWLNIPELVEILPVMLITFLLSALVNVSSSLISRDMRFRFLATVDVATFALGYGAVAVTLAFLGFSYWALIIGMLVRTVLSAAIILWKRPVWPTLDLRSSDVGPLLNFGGGVFLAQMMSNIAQRADNLVVTSTMGPAALGFYSRAYSLMELSNKLLGSVFRETLFTGFSKQRREGMGTEGRADAFLMAHTFATFLILPIAVAMFVLAEEIILILLGSQWGEAAPVLKVLALGMFFRLGYKVSHGFNLSAGRVYQTAALTSLYAVAVVIGAAVGARFGLAEVALGVLVALAINFVMLTSLAFRHVPAGWVDLGVALAPLFTAALASVPVCVGLSQAVRDTGMHPGVVLFAGVVGMAAAYGAALFVLRRTTSVGQMILSGRVFLHGEAPERIRDSQ